MSGEPQAKRQKTEEELDNNLAELTDSSEESAGGHLSTSGDSEASTLTSGQLSNNHMAIPTFIAPSFIITKKDG
jgi:hypothetical protein